MTLLSYITGDLNFMFWGGKSSLTFFPLTRSGIPEYAYDQMTLLLEEMERTCRILQTEAMEAVKYLKVSM